MLEILLHSAHQKDSLDIGCKIINVVILNEVKYLKQKLSTNRIPEIPAYVSLWPVNLILLHSSE